MVFKDRTKGERDNRNTGQRDWKDGEMVKRGSGETVNLRITIYASRITNPASRITLHEGGASLGLPSPKD